MTEHQNTQCPWGTRTGWTLGVVFCAMMVCMLLDREAEKVMRVLGWVLLLVAAVGDRQASARQYKVAVPVALGVVVAAMVGAGSFWGDVAGAAVFMVKYHVPLIWLTVIWLALPVFGFGAGESCDITRRGLCWWVRGTVGLLLAFCFWASLSAGASLFPKESFELLGADLLPYAGAFIILIRAAACYGQRWWQGSARMSWWVMVAASAGMAVVVLAGLISREAGNSLLEAGMFRVDEDAPDTRRLQFLFSHHNRAGYFSALAIFLCLAGAWGRGTWRWVGIAGAAAAAFALPFTLTRGALVAAMVAMFLFILGGAVGRRGRTWMVVAGVLVLLPAGWLVLPDKYQEHISKIADPDNYSGHATGSIGARLIMWDAANYLIDKRPGLGFGYGFENFEKTLRLETQNPDFFAGASHAHNQWLETAAETGIAGAALLFVFMLARLGGLAWAWWRAWRRRGGSDGNGLAWLVLLWLCLEIVILIYGMTNYTLRRNLGFLTYWVWAGSVVVVLLIEGRRHITSVEQKTR